MRLSSLEKRLERLENKPPGPLMYRRPGGEDHENLVDFLNDQYIELQKIKVCLADLLQQKVQ